MPSVSRRHVLFTAAGTAALLATGAWPAAAGVTSAANTADLDDPTVVVEWNRALLRIVRTPGAQPATVHPTRSFAMLHGAIHDAVVSTTHSHHGRQRTAPIAAAAAAGHDVLVALYPSMTAALDQQLATDLAMVIDADARDAGIRAGQRAAQRMLRQRADDGSSATPPAITPGTLPGQYRPDPPNFPTPVFTHWAAVTPFVLDDADQFRPRPYPALNGAEYANAINEVKSLGRNTSTTRTEDQTVHGRFWAAPIWNYWNEITQNVVLARHSGLATAARVFAQLNLTFADSVIAFYDAKYHFRVWRPVTAIRLADNDTNPATTGDPTWVSLANTPADPSYPGAHSVIAQAGANVLRHTYGPQQHLTVTSEVLAGTVRTFDRFQGAADEAGLSRIFAGLHTRIDHEAGQLLGANVARFLLTDGQDD
ncbi:MAG TPA: vanadium-dependent haloperoxidase [Pseudonocardiaceae bacterium]|nr:vanadium-dependent haloperoxidase [Pseudonocardiaceae bacterium]